MKPSEFKRYRSLGRHLFVGGKTTKFKSAIGTTSGPKFKTILEFQEFVECNLRYTPGFFENFFAIPSVSPYPQPHLCGPRLLYACTTRSMHDIVSHPNPKVVDTRGAFATLTLLTFCAKRLTGTLCQVCEASGQ